MSLSEEDKKGISEEDMYLFDNPKGEKILRNIQNLLQEIVNSDKQVLEFLTFQLNEGEGVTNVTYLQYYEIAVYMSILNFIEKSFKNK